MSLSSIVDEVEDGPSVVAVAVEGEEEEVEGPGTEISFRVFNIDSLVDSDNRVTSSLVRPIVDMGGSTVILN